MSELQKEVSTENQDVRLGFGGGLIILVIALLILPINILAYYKTDVLTFFTGGSFSIMLEMSPVWSLLILIDFITLPAGALFSLVLISLIFMKKRFVPKALMILFATLAILAILDYAANNMLAHYASEKMKDDINLRIIKHASKMLIYCLIFIPYLMFSQRIKAIYLQK